MLPLEQLGSAPLEPAAVAAAESSTIADSGLRCPACKYNLTGVIEDRCPECGKAFDRERLLAILAGAPAPIPIWDDASRNVVLRFTYMCLLTWFCPIRLSRMLPKNHSAASTRTFRRLVLAIAVLVGWAAATAVTGPAVGFAIIAVFGTTYITGIILTELMFAAIFEGAMSAELRSDLLPISASFAWWQSIFGFFRSFVLMELAAIGLVVGMDIWSRRPPSDPPLLVALPVAWWWLNVCIVLAVQRTRSYEKIATIVMTPIFLGMAAVVAACTGAMIGGLVVGIMKL